MISGHHLSTSNHVILSYTTCSFPALAARGLGALHARKARAMLSAGGACYFDTREKLLGCSCSRYRNNHHPALRGSSTLTNSQLNQYGRSLPFASGSWSCDGIGGVQGGVVMCGKAGRGEEMDCEGQVYGGICRTMMRGHGPQNTLVNYQKQPLTPSLTVGRRRGSPAGGRGGRGGRGAGRQRQRQHVCPRCAQGRAQDLPHPRRSCPRSP